MSNDIKGLPEGSVEAINFVADAGRQMLESSTSVSEVQDRLRRLAGAVGLEGCAIDATMSSLILSYWRPGQGMPLTTMREVRVATPRLDRLAGADQILTATEIGEIDVAEASERLRELESAPSQSRLATRMALIVSVVGWVIFVDGFDALTLLVAVVATLLTFPVASLVQRFGLPSLAETVVVALIVAGVPNLVAAAGVSIEVGAAVVGALFVHLPGRALVSAVIDGIANAPISAISRGMQAITTAGWLALGMLVGSRIGTGLGLSYELDVTGTPLVLALIGAGVGVLGLSVAWAMPRPQLLPTVLISAGGWLIVSIATQNTVTSSDWPPYAIAAGFVGFAGAFASHWQGPGTSVYIGPAILPLVPGFTLYAGMLAIAQGDTSQALSALGGAGAVSLAIAIGVAIGLSLGQDTLAVGRRVMTVRPKSQMNRNAPEDRADGPTEGD